MFASPPKPAVVQEASAIPHQWQITPLTGVQLTNVMALSSVVQSAVVQERSTWVKPVRVALVPQLGKTLVLRVLVLTMLTVVVTVSPETSASGPGGGPPGVHCCPWLGERTMAPLACVVHICALARAADSSSASAGMMLIHRVVKNLRVVRHIVRSFSHRFIREGQVLRHTPHHHRYPSRTNHWLSGYRGGCQYPAMHRQGTTRVEAHH